MLDVSFPFKSVGDLSEICYFAIISGVIDETVRPGFKSTQVAAKELNPDGFQGDKAGL